MWLRCATSIATTTAQPSSARSTTPRTWSAGGAGDSSCFDAAAALARIGARIPVSDGRAGRAVASVPGNRDRRGRSGPRRAGWSVTPTRGDPRESATENRPPLAAVRYGGQREGGKGGGRD